jgi:hypothetical protein
MSDTLRELIASLTSMGGETAAANHDRFAADLAALLALGPSHVADRTGYRTALAHGFAYYFWSWDRRAVQLHAAVEQAIIHWAAVAAPDIDLLCELTDFLFFVAWCFNESSTRQCQWAMRGMQATAVAFGRTARLLSPPPVPDGPVHVVWLTMVASASEPRVVGLRHVAPALLAQHGRFRLSVVAWRSAEPEFFDWLRDLGATCHLVTAPRPTELVQAIEALVATDPPTIAVSDLNTAVPTALFARGLAPAQVFLQGGMPAWPVRPLHGVFNSFGFDPAVAGWGAARVLTFNPPWDLARLNPPEDVEEVARQRAGLPQGLRLIGNYSRLVKLTTPCLQAAESILQRCPDVAFVTGGTGDASTIRAFMASSPVGERMRVVEGFVPGQSWGRLLEVYLDTWPVTGGGSCREMIAKGRPVVTMHSTEMPAIDLQRDPMLMARNWRDYADLAVRLLRDPLDYAAACARAAALALAMADGGSFAARLTADLDAVLDDVGGRRSQSQQRGIWSAVRRLLNRNIRP